MFVVHQVSGVPIGAVADGGCLEYDTHRVGATAHCRVANCALGARQPGAAAVRGACQAQDAQQRGRCIGAGENPIDGAAIAVRYEMRYTRDISGGRKQYKPGGDVPYGTDHDHGRESDVSHHRFHRRVLRCGQSS